MEYEYIGNEKQLIEIQKILNEELKPLLNEKIRILQSSIPIYLLNKNIDEVEVIYNEKTQQYLNLIEDNIENIKERYRQKLISKKLIKEIRSKNGR